jgi:hypothetical protein
MRRGREVERRRRELSEEILARSSDERDEGDRRRTLDDVLKLEKACKRKE